MAIKAMSSCSRTRFCAVLTMIFLLKSPSVSCSRPIPGASVFHLFSSWSQTQLKSLNPSGIPAVHDRFMTSVENLEQAQTSTSSGLNAADYTKDQGLDSELQKDSKLETKGEGDSEFQKRFRLAPVFQMLPRNTRPPPRGPSPGSNSLGSP